MKKKWIASVLLAGLLPSLFSCGGDVPETETAMETEAAAIETETEAAYTSSIEQQDFGGEEIRFYTYSNSHYQNSLMDIAAEELTGEVLNDAVFERNNLLHEKFNIVLTWQDLDGRSKLDTALRTAVTSGDREACDIVNNSTESNILAGIDGYLLPAGEFPYIYPEKPWWNRKIMEDTSILGQNYFLVGDMNLDTWTQSYVVYFSKDMAEDYQIENLYDIVREGGWTIDKLDEITRRIYVDTNGNSEYDENDTYGFSACSVCVDCFWVSGAISFVEKDSEDALSIAISDAYYEMYEKISTLLAAPEMLYTDRPQYTAKRDTYDRGAFIENRALFFLEGLCVGDDRLREMEYPFGILPVPKFNEIQETYCTYSHYGHNSSIALPLTSGDQVDMLCMILEDMAFYSMDTVRPAYYDKMLEGRLAASEDDRDMLEIITTNISYNIANLLFSGDMWSLRNAVSAGDPPASFMASKEQSWTSKIKTIQNSIAENIENQG
ncbi:MAG: hypothetical protein IJX14_01790 [Clostridia bacterium]|nr:hypothetical protein [Clostridia bacterium]